jgi:streptogramin lyase
VLVVAAVAALVAAGGVAALAMQPGDDKPRSPRSAVQAAAPERGIEVDATRVGGRPNIVLGAGGHVWVGRFLNPRLAALDPATGGRTKAPRPEIGVGLLGLAASGRDLWALASRARQLVHLDARTGRRIGEPVALPSAANAVAATPDSVYVAVTQPVLDPGDQILEFDARTGALRRSLGVRDGVRRLEVAAGWLWLLASDPAELVGIDLDDPGKRRHVDLESDSSGDLALGAGSLWVTLVDTDQLARVDPRGGKPATFPTGRRPSGVVVRKGTVWVANRTSSTVSRIDVRSGRPHSDIRVPINPYDVAAYRDSIWVTSLTEGRIARITGLDD